MSGVAEEVSIDGDGFTLPLVSPAGVVPEEGTQDKKGKQQLKAAVPVKPVLQSRPGGSRPEVCNMGAWLGCNPTNKYKMSPQSHTQV